MRSYLIAILILFCSYDAGAQKTKGFSTGKKNITRGKTYALIIGISNYQNNGIPSLKYADKDALAFRDYLIGCGADSNLITLRINEEAKSGTIWLDINNLLETVNPEDRVYFYFSGHGDVESKTLTKAAHLLTYDTPKLMYANTSLSITQLQDYLGTISAKGAELIFVCDACHSGNLAGEKEGMRAAAAALGTRWHDEIKILSCSPGEFSLEGPDWGNGRGLFSYEFVNGITGLADKNQDGKVLLKELNLYLINTVVEGAGSISQTPVITGDMETEMSIVHPHLVSNLSHIKPSDPWAKVESKGIEESVLKTQPDSIQNFYNLFLECMNTGKLSSHDHINTGAYEYLHKIPENDSTRILISIMKRNLSSKMINEVNYYVNYSLDNQGYDNYGFAIYYTYDYYTELCDLIGIHKLRSLGFLPKVLFMKILYDEYILIPSKNAIATLDTILAMDPNAAYALSLYAYIEKKRKNYESARDYALRAMDVSPKFAYPYQVLAETYINLDKFDSSMIFTNKLLELDSSFMGCASLLLSLNYYFLNKIDSSNYYFEEYFRIINSIKDCWNCELTSIFSSQSKLKADTKESMAISGKEMGNEDQFKIPVDNQSNSGSGIYSKTNPVNSSIKSFEGLDKSDYYFGNISNNYLQSTNYKDNLFEFISANNAILQNRGEKLEENENESENRMYFAPANILLSGSIYFQLACQFAESGRERRALHYLDRAINNGFNNYSLIEKSTKLDNIRSYSYFKNLMSEYFSDQYAGN